MACVENDRPVLDLILVDLARSGPALLALEEAEPRLCDKDQQHSKAASNAGLARRRRAAHIALRLLLEHYAGRDAVRAVAFHRGEYGRPSLPFVDPESAEDTALGPADTGAQSPAQAGFDLHFSISYSGDEALIALARNGAVGVDLERPREIRLSPARRARIQAAARMLVAERGAKVTPEAISLEAREMHEPGQAEFLQAWTRLEALAKATGLGVARLFSQFDLFGPDKLWTPDHDASVRDFFAGTGLAVSDLDLGADRFAAVAKAGNRQSLSANEAENAIAGPVQDLLPVRELPIDKQSLRAIAVGDLAPSDLPAAIPA